MQLVHGDRVEIEMVSGETGAGLMTFTISVLDVEQFARQLSGFRPLRPTRAKRVRR